MAAARHGLSKRGPATCAGRSSKSHPRLHPPDLPRALPAHQSPHRQKSATTALTGRCTNTRPNLIHGLLHREGVAGTAAETKYLQTQRKWTSNSVPSIWDWLWDRFSPDAPRRRAISKERPRCRHDS
jgi:hypothetical protein